MPADDPYAPPSGQAARHPLRDRPDARSLWRAARLFIVLWFVIGGAGALMVWGESSTSLRIRGELRRFGVITSATVVRTTPQDHDSLTFEYVVGGRKFVANRVSGLPNPQADDLHVGDVIVAAYSGRDPSISCACNPSIAFATNDVPFFAAFTALGAALPVLGIVTLRYRRGWVS